MATATMERKPARTGHSMLGREHSHSAWVTNDLDRAMEVFKDRYGITEFRLLEVLYAHLGEVQSKAFLYQQVLHRGFPRHDRVLDMHISNLRRKLSQAGVDMLRLESVWGHGYLLSRDSL